MKLIFLGTGTSQGVPPIASDYPDLDLSNRKNWRTRASVHVDMDGFRVQVDAAPELRLQCIDNKIEWLDLFLLTHGHADHIAGMDDLRRFCDIREDNTIPVYADRYGIERIAAMFPYALGDKPVERGYPCFRVKLMPPVMELAGGRKILSTPLPHGPINTLGFVFEHKGKKLAYYTDCKRLTDEAFELARGADCVVLDALKPKEHPSHMSIFEAVETAQRLGAKQSFFTHTTWQIDYAQWETRLPANCHIAYDGLVVEV